MNFRIEDVILIVNEMFHDMANSFTPAQSGEGDHFLVDFSNVIPDTVNIEVEACMVYGDSLYLSNNTTEHKYAGGFDSNVIAKDYKCFCIC